MTGAAKQPAIAVIQPATQAQATATGQVPTAGGSSGITANGVVATSTATAQIASQAVIQPATQATVAVNGQTVTPAVKSNAVLATSTSAAYNVTLTVTPNALLANAVAAAMAASGFVAPTAIMATARALATTPTWSGGIVTGGQAPMAMGDHPSSSGVGERHSPSITGLPTIVVSGDDQGPRGEGQHL